MAKEFVEADSEGLYATVSLPASPPWSMSAWINLTQLGGGTPPGHFAFGLTDLSVNTRRWWCLVNENDTVRLFAQSGGSTAIANPLFTIPAANVWHHVLISEHATDDRYIWVDGVNDAHNTATINFSSALDTISIGHAKYTAGNLFYSNMRVAEVCFWDAALTIDDAKQLYAGYSPLFTKPQNISYFMPLVRGNNCRCSSTTLSETGTPIVADHPRIRVAPPIEIHQPITRAPEDCDFGTLQHATSQRGAIGLKLEGDTGLFHTFTIEDGDIDANIGSLISFIETESDYSTLDSFIIVDIVFDISNRLYLRWESTNQRIEFNMIVNGDKYSVNVAAALESNVSYMVAASWGAGFIRVYFNGTTAELEKPGNSPKESFPATVYLGSSFNYDDPMTGTIWNVAILTRSLRDSLFDFYERYYRNFRLADFVRANIRHLWYGDRETRPKYRLGN